MKNLIIFVLGLMCLLSVSAQEVEPSASPPTFIPTSYQEFVAYAMESCRTSFVYLGGPAVVGEYTTAIREVPLGISTASGFGAVFSQEMVFDIYADTPGKNQLWMYLSDERGNTLFYGGTSFEFEQDKYGQWVIPDWAKSPTLTMESEIPIKAPGIVDGEITILDQWGNRIGNHWPWINDGYVYIPTSRLYNGYDLRIKLHDKDGNEWVYTIDGKPANQEEVRTGLSAQVNGVKDLSLEKGGCIYITVNQYGDWIEPVLYTYKAVADESLCFQVQAGYGQPRFNSVKLRIQTGSWNNRVWTEWEEFPLEKDGTLELDCSEDCLIQIYPLAKPGWGEKG